MYPFPYPFNLATILWVASAYLHLSQNGIPGRVWLRKRKDGGRVWLRKTKMVWRNISCPAPYPYCWNKMVNKRRPQTLEILIPSSIVQWFVPLATCVLLALAANCLQFTLLGNTKSKWHLVACLYSLILSISILNKIDFFISNLHMAMKCVIFKYMPSNITLPCNDDFQTVVHC